MKIHIIFKIQVNKVKKNVCNHKFTITIYEKAYKKAYKKIK